MTDFQTQCLQAHNMYRRRHGVPALTLDPMICQVAQQFANQLAATNTFQHSNNPHFGENIATMYSYPNMPVSGEAIVKMWYDEIRNHPFGMEPASLASGHFTQLVWKASSRLGVGMAQNGNRVIVVANYYPRGNVIGSFSMNVPPPTYIRQWGRREDDPVYNGINLTPLPAINRDKVQRYDDCDYPDGINLTPLPAINRDKVQRYDNCDYPNGINLTPLPAINRDKVQRYDNCDYPNGINLTPLPAINKDHINWFNYCDPGMNSRQWYPNEDSNFNY